MSNIDGLIKRSMKCSVQNLVVLANNTINQQF